jgi:hypothetical protein
MIGRVRLAWRTRPRLTVAFVMACVVTVFFAGRLLVQTVYWSAHQDLPVLPWMTVGYIARSWDLDPREIEAVAGLPAPAERGSPEPLAEIAKDIGVPVETVIADIEKVITQLRADQGRE